MVAINIPADGLSIAVYKEIKENFSYVNCRRIVRSFIDKHLTSNPDVIILNICYRRSLTPSDVFDSVLYNIETDENGFAVRNEIGESVKTLSSESIKNTSRFFDSFFSVYRKLLKNDIDIINFAVEKIRESGCKVWISFRMNDHHFLDNPAINSSFAYKNRGEMCFSNGSYNYTKRAVQNYYLEYINEQISRYDIDGIELDWLRSPGVVPQKACDYCTVLNNFNIKVRKMLDSYEATKGKKLSLAVRVLSNEAQNISYGMDVSAWVALGAVDTVTVSNFFTPTNYEFPIEDWRNAINKRNIENHPYTLFCCSDWSVFCKPHRNLYMTPAMVRGFATQSIGRGADGVYLFNYFEEDSDTSQEFYIDNNGVGKIRDCFKERMKAASEPVNSLPRRHIFTGVQLDRYPIKIEANSSYEFDIYTGKVPNIYRLLIGTDTIAYIDLLINGNYIKADLNKVKQFDGFEYCDIQSDKGVVKSDITVYAPCQLAKNVSYVNIPIEFLKDGINNINIKNTDKNNFSVEWLEIICE